MKKISLNLGCGIGFVKNFINVDNFIDEKKTRKKTGEYVDSEIGENAIFVKGDMRALPFKDNYADYIESVDAIEHISHIDIGKVFSEMYRVLKPGGELVLFTTDFDELARLWSGYIADKPFDFEKYHDLMEVIYGNQHHDGEYHKIPFNKDFLSKCLIVVGFKAEDIKMIIYPTNCATWPPLKTWPKKKDQVIRTQMIYVSVKKQK